MNFDIFDENYYLLKYPWVKNAIEAGKFTSGLDHFQKVGMQQQGLTEISRYFDESYYLANNPDVANAVQSGNFPSGLAHFIQSGYEEGRTNISPSYNEDYYLKRYPGLVPFIQQGAFQSGLQHFLLFGEKEGRFATNFLEAEYLKKYPDVADAVKAGLFKTGFEHYLKAGQFEPSRSATFMGTNESDIVQGFGVGTVELTGVPISLDGSGNRIYERDVNRFNRTSSVEQDTLIGASGADKFILGGNSTLGSDSSFYPWMFGPTTILNFDPTKDVIQLGGLVTNYKLASDSSSDLYIITPSKPGAEAILKGGVDFPKVAPTSKWIVGSKVTAIDNFAEALYLDKNPDVAAAVKAGIFASGLEHYQKFGQFEPSRSSAFVGSNGNDTITAFGVGQKDIIGVSTEYVAGANHLLSNGSNEFDTLIGSEGRDRFILGDYYQTGRTFFPVVSQLYKGAGEALIRNFNQSQGDQIQLMGKLNDYQISPVGADLVISQSGDTIARLEGGASLNLQVLKAPQDFYFGDRFILG